MKTSPPSFSGHRAEPVARARRTGALQYLQQLPEVFDLTTFMMLSGVKASSARVMLSRWAAQGLIAHAGAHAGLYYQRVLQRQSDDEQRACAVLTLHPRAIVAGPTILHAHGWTTQIPRALHFNVTADRRIHLHGVEFSPRPSRWFALIEQHRAQALEPETGGIFHWDRLPKLTPAWALADLLTQPRSAWHPDPDDLDVPEEARASVMQAAQALGAPEKVLAVLDVLPAL